MTMYFSEALKRKYSRCLDNVFSEENDSLTPLEKLQSFYFVLTHKAWLLPSALLLNLSHLQRKREDNLL